MRKELGAARDEVLWEMPIPELNLMLHSYYFMDGRDTRKTSDRIKIHSKFDRLFEMFKRK